MTHIEVYTLGDGYPMHDHILFLTTEKTTTPKLAFGLLDHLLRQLVVLRVVLQPRLSSKGFVVTVPLGRLVRDLLNAGLADLEVVEVTESNVEDGTVLGRVDVVS